MSEKRAVYNSGESAPKTLAAFKNRPCAMPNSSGFYKPPSKVEIDSLVALAGWSQTDVAKLVGVSYNHKGSSTVRKWKSPPESSEFRMIPYSAWRLLLICAGVISSGRADAGALTLSKARNDSVSQDELNS